MITAYQLLGSSYDIGIGYGDDVTQAHEIALEVLQKVEGVLADPAPSVLLWDLAGSSKSLRLT